MSAQTGGVVGHGLDFLVAHLGGDGGHLDAVGALTGAEGVHLGLEVLDVLATQARVLGRDAGAVRAVAAGAGRDLLVGDAAAPDLLAQGDGVLVLGGAGDRLLAAVEGGDVLHVLGGQRGRHAVHHGVLALAFLELGQLLDDVVGVLALQDGVGGDATRTVVGVAGAAGGGDLLALGDVGLGRRRGGLIGEDGRRHEGGEHGGEGERDGGLHCEGPADGSGMREFLTVPPRPDGLPTGVRAGPNRQILQCSMTQALRPVTPTPSDAERTALAWAHNARFLTTASQLNQLPAGDLPEIAFVGRSNAGKSTAINTLAQRRQLAFASKTPGRTQHINLFALGPKDEPDAYLADLPGYGYATVERGAKLRWQKVMADYLEVRRNLHGVVMMVDSRLGFTPLDQQLLDFVAPRVTTGEVKLLVLLTKAEKLTRAEGAQSLAAAQEVLAPLANEASDVGMLLFSGPNRIGLADLATTLHDWTRPAAVAETGAAAGAAAPAEPGAPAAPDATDASPD